MASKQYLKKDNLISLQNHLEPSLRARSAKQSPSGLLRHSVPRNDFCSSSNLYALILAGGVGSRFWPFSRELQPKQFMNIIGKESLLQNTVRRLKGLVKPKQIYFITNQSYFYELKKQIEALRIPARNIILEPESKNTAPAIGLCARLIEQAHKDAVLMVLPSDHYIKGLDKFKACLRRAAVCASNDFLVTIGIKPKNPAT